MDVRQPNIASECRPADNLGEAPTVCISCGGSLHLQAIARQLARCGVCGYLTPLPRRHPPAPLLDAVDETLPLTIGSVLRERYRLIDVLGRGAHGVTYLAHHELLDHPCVVKLLPFGVEDWQDTAARRLRSEASAGFLVADPNVVRVLDCDVAQNLWYLVMEFVDGVDLRAILRTGLRVPWRQAACFALDAARGLESIHRAGLLHRDLKPDNLIFAVDGRVRILDLGVAAFIRRRPEQDRAVASEPIGTLAYTAPEMFTAPGKADERADLYALGAAFFELLVGRPPHGTSLYRTLLNSNASVVRWPANADADIPGSLVELVLQLLQPNPTDRPPTAAVVARAIERQKLNGKPHRVHASPAGGESLPRAGVAILPLKATAGDGQDEWLGFAMADHISRALTTRFGAFVVDRDQFAATLERIQTRSAGDRAAHLQHAGRLSGAGAVVEGTFDWRGGDLTVRMRLLREGQTTAEELSAVSGHLSALDELEQALTWRVAEAIGLEARPQAGAPIRRTSLEAERRYVTGRRAFLRGDYAAARALADEAIALDADYADAIGLAAVCAGRMGNYADAEILNGRQLALAERTRDERLKVESFANLGTMHYFRGDHPSAYENLARAVEVAETLGMHNEVALIRNNLGFILLQLGRTDDAQSMFAHAIETHLHSGALVSAIAPLNGLGHVARTQERYDQAREHFRRALRLAQESEDLVNVGVAYMNLGHCALLQGQIAEAKDELAVALNVLEQTSFWNGLARVYEHMGDLNLRLSNWMEAVRCADRRIDLAQRHANRSTESAAWRQRAQALRALGRAADADAALRRADTTIPNVI